MTYTSGYFNAKTWPIQIVISRLNITLHLKPGEFILDRQGRKINDPYFEAYTASEQLQRETLDKAVPMIRVPVVTTTTTPQVHDGHSVRTVTEFKLSETGVREPVIPKPMEVPEQTINKVAVSAFTMEEARSRGLVRKVREVPEDYGATDTAGLPPSQVPKIKYAVDSGMTKPVKDLPPELLEMPKDIAAARTPLVQALRQGAKTNANLDSESGFMNTVVQNAPPNAPLVAGKPATASGVAPELPSVDESLPAPVLEESQESDTFEPAPEEVIEEAPVSQAEPQPEAEGPFVCCICKAQREIRVQLLKHAQSKHANRVAEVMAPYPR